MTEANETGRPLGLASTAGLGARVAQVREQLVSVDVQRYFARLHTEDSARIAMLEAELRKVWPGTQDDLRARLDWVRMMSLSRESLQKLGLEAPNVEVTGLGRDE